MIKVFTIKVFKNTQNLIISQITNKILTQQKNGIIFIH